MNIPVLNLRNDSGEFVPYAVIQGPPGEQGPQGPSGTDIESYVISEPIDNGERGYIRYKNGLQYAWARVYFSTSISSSWGILYESSDVTAPAFAASFSDTPTIIWGLENMSAGCMIEYYSRTSSDDDNTNNTYPGFVNLVRPNSSSSVTGYLTYLAIGKWK